MRSKSKQADFLVTALIFILPKAYSHSSSCTSYKYPNTASLFKSTPYHTHGLSDRGRVYRVNLSLSASMLVSVAKQEGATQRDTHSSFKCHGNLRTDKAHNRDIASLIGATSKPLWRNTRTLWQMHYFPGMGDHMLGPVCDLFGLKR